MPIIIRETRTIAGKEYPNTKVYKSDKPITKEGKIQADELDVFLKDKMSEIEKEMKKYGFIKLKNKKGVLRLWYEIGKRLDFVDDPEIVPPQDRKYIWRALYDHAGELVSEKLSVRAKERPKNNLFRYCYILAKYEWNFVNNAGNWTAWSEFLDSPVIINDKRIIDWLGSIQLLAVGSLQDWLRGLTKKIRAEFKNKDTSVFSDDELNKKLSKILKVYPD